MSNNENMEDRRSKLREERAAREQARLQKLRELNMKKYPKSDSQANLATNQPSSSKISKTTSTSQIKYGNGTVSKNSFHANGIKTLKNNFHVNGTSKRPITAPAPKKVDYKNVKAKILTKFDSKTKVNTQSDNHETTAKIADTHIKTIAESVNENTKAEIEVEPSTSNVTLKDKKISVADKATTQNKDNQNQTTSDTSIENKVLTDITKKEVLNPKIFRPNPKLRKSIAAFTNTNGFNKQKHNDPARKSMLPKPVENNAARKSMLPKFEENNTARKSMLPKFEENNTARKSVLPKLEETKSESVFERLYKPKYIAKKPADEVDKIQTDPNYLKKIIKTSRLILNKRHTVFETKTTENGILPRRSISVNNVPPRRSISAVHFKRISKNEINNCIHKWGSIGDKLNKKGLEMNEDEGIKEQKITSAIKSERKKVQFMTPTISNFNTPRPEELQARLKSWLQKRGKSLDSYHHLQCFGIHHLKPDPITLKNIQFEDAVQTPTKANFDEENKENIALDSDSDDGSYADTMNELTNLSSGDKIDTVNWRNASIDSESLGINESNHLNDTTITSADTLANVDELLLGALNDLAAMIHEGFDWQQAARWLRSIRSRFPSAPKTAAYWECRAALEDARGDLPASVQCWEEAIAKGTERSVAESSLDQLLDKFMQLKISPQSGAARQPDPKLVDVKNVFKSTIIRFAVQQAKLRHSDQATPVFTVTPVRRSARLSHCPRQSRTPLRLCDSVRQAATIAPQHVFTPNDNFVHTP